MNPFSLIFLACLLPSIGAFFDLPVFHLYGFLFAGGFGLMVLKSKGRVNFREFKNNPALTLFFFLTSFLLVFQVLTGRGFVMLSGGLYTIIIGYILLKMFSDSGGIPLEKTIQGVSSIYKFLLVCMLGEFLIIVLNQQELLTTFFYSARTTGYRGQLALDIPRIFGLLENAGGLNSILMGAQIAGMISLFSLIWFLGTRKIKLKDRFSPNSKLWVGVAAFCLGLTINGMNMLLLLIGMLFYGLFVYKKHLLPILLGLIVIIGVAFILVKYNLIFGRIFSDSLLVLDSEKLERNPELAALNGITKIEYYMYVMLLIPFSVFYSLDFLDLVFGVGGDGFLNRYSFFGSDFGFGTDVLLKSGFLWAIVLVSFICVVCFKNLKPPPKILDSTGGWSFLASINALISLLWLFSTLHYDQAFGHSGVGNVLFGMHLALTLYCGRRYRAAKTS